MKKLVATIVALSTLAGVNECFGAFAVVNLNNFDSNNPIFYLTDGSNAPADGNTFVQLLGGPNMEPVATAQGTSIFNLIPGVDGFFDGGFGRVPGATPNGTADFQLRAWRGAATYDAASEKGISGVFSNPTGTEPDIAGGDPPGAPQPALASNFPSVTIVPEPTTYLLALLGGAALFLFRRRK